MTAEALNNIVLIAIRTKKLIPGPCSGGRDGIAASGSIINTRKTEGVGQEEIGRNCTVRKRKVLIIGDNLLRGMECHVSRPDPLAHEVCCLSGAKLIIRILKLIKPTE